MQLSIFKTDKISSLLCHSIHLQIYMFSNCFRLPPPLEHTVFACHWSYRFFVLNFFCTFLLRDFTQYVRLDLDFDGIIYYCLRAFFFTDDLCYLCRQFASLHLFNYVYCSNTVLIRIHFGTRFVCQSAHFCCFCLHLLMVLQYWLADNF